MRICPSNVSLVQASPDDKLTEALCHDEQGQTYLEVARTFNQEELSQKVEKLKSNHAVLSYEKDHLLSEYGIIKNRQKKTGFNEFIDYITTGTATVSGLSFLFGVGVPFTDELFQLPEGKAIQDSFYLKELKKLTPACQSAPQVQAIRSILTRASQNSGKLVAGLVTLVGGAIAFNAYNNAPEKIDFDIIEAEYRSKQTQDYEKLVTEYNQFTQETAELRDKKIPILKAAIQESNREWIAYKMGVPTPSLSDEQIVTWIQAQNQSHNSVIAHILSGAVGTCLAFGPGQKKALKIYHSLTEKMASMQNFIGRGAQNLISHRSHKASLKAIAQERTFQLIKDLNECQEEPILQMRRPPIVVTVEQPSVEFSTSRQPSLGFRVTDIRVEWLSTIRLKGIAERLGDYAGVIGFGILAGATGYIAKRTQVSAFSQAAVYSGGAALAIWATAGEAQAASLQKQTTITVESCEESVEKSDENCTSLADAVRVTRMAAPALQEIAKPLFSLSQKF